MSLSPSHQAIYDQLLSITSSTTQPAAERDLAILRDCRFELEAALEVILSIPDSERDAERASSSRPSPPSPDRSSSRANNPRSDNYSSFEFDDSSQSQPLLPSSSTSAGSGGGGARDGVRPLAGFRVPRGLRGITRVGMGLGWTLYSIILWPVGLIWGIVLGGWGFVARYLPPSILSYLPASFQPSRTLSSSSSPNSYPGQPKPHATLLFLRQLESLTNARSPSSSSSASPSSSRSAQIDRQGEKGDEEELEKRDGEDPVELPEFFIGKYRDALDQAKKQGKIVLVGLFSSSHESDEQFKKNVLTDTSLIEGLKTNRVIFWAGDISERESYQVSRLLPPTSYPSFTFIAPLSPPPHIAPPKLSILARLESSSTTPESLLQTLHNTVLPLAQPTFNALRREERLRAEERRLREEQDRAFREAERSDLERILKAREEREGEERRQREESRKREEAVERERRREAWLRYGKSAILGDQAGGSEEEGGVYVTLRFTKGDQRAHHRRRFPSSTPIQHLYLWAATISLPSDDSDGRPSSPPSLAPPGTERWTEPEGGWGFRLATSYPRRVLDVEGVDGEECVGESKTLKEGAGVLVFESVQEGRKEGEEDGSSEEETSGDEDDEDEEGASA